MTTYRLVAPAPAAPVPRLDPGQQAVVDHPSGPLLVLAGPGTGKTTTMVEAIVERVEGRGLAPEAVLALTFSRKAADQVRTRVATRLGRTTGTVAASTFHSFAWGLVRRFAPAELYAAPLRLLSAPEQDVVIAEMLRPTSESVRWPDRFSPALGTRGFVREVQSVLGRARERGLDPLSLVELGRREGADELVAAGLFMERYLQVLDDVAAIDYPDVIARAVVEAQRHREELRARYAVVFVDEYQDTDPSQVALLDALAGDGRDLVAVGDPDQSIYGFRGADVRGILDFPRRFVTASGEPAPVVSLATTRRFGSEVAAAAARVASRLPVVGAIGAQAYATFRHPVPQRKGGQVEVLTFDTARGEADHIADLLRRAHLLDGVPWGRMAVLARSGRSTLPGLRRALGSAGVPVEVALDEVPLTREPAAAALLAGLRAILDPTAEGVEDLLTGPLGGLDATQVRAVGRRLRARDGVTALRELLRAVVFDPDLARVAEAGDLAARMSAARQQADRGATAEEVLWTLWDGSGWQRRLVDAVERGGSSARTAHRDLDSVCALFETAAKVSEQRTFVGIGPFLDTLTAQEIPADTLAERGVRGDCVRLLTAHRAKGLEWDLVVVAHVQDGAWPDLRRRGTLLGADRISHDELLPPQERAALLADERRLFYVACTRARERLVVTAVDSRDPDGETASRFLTELVEEPARHVVGRPARPLSLPGLVAELRRTVTDPDQPDHLRAAAAARLRRLAPEVASARPENWWGVRPLSHSATPLRPVQEPLVITASALEAINQCPAKWFLEREAGGERPSTSSQGFGTIVHALAERVATGELAQAGIGDLMTLVDEVWDRMDWRTPWTATRERAAIAEVLARFLTWHRSPGARTVIGREARLDIVVSLPDPERTGEELMVRLYGYADRLELDETGRVVVVDLKTGKYPPADKDLPANAQLGLYQLAVAHGAAEQWAPGAECGGAELVQLRKDANRSPGIPKVQRQEPPDAEEPPPVTRQIQLAATMLRTEQLIARDGSHCDFCDFCACCPVKSGGSVLS
ncbi:MAG: ATP-dependent helicase [Nocardioides sp.]